MDYISLISRYESTLSSDDIRKYKAFLSKMQTSFNDNFEVWDIDRIKSLFRMKSGIISKTSFYETKKWFGLTISELAKDGLISDKLHEALNSQINNIRIEDVSADDEIRHTYFKNIDTVLSFISLVGSQSGSDDMAFIKSYAILVWHGFSVEDIVSITKNSLIADKCMICFNGHKKIISQKEFDILERFANQTSYLGIKGGSRTYIPSIYLFRSYNKPKLEENNLNCEIYAFNKEAEGYGKKLIYTSLSLNGLFYDILLEEENNNIQSVNDYMIKKYGMNKSTASHKTLRYKIWKNIYYN